MDPDSEAARRIGEVLRGKWKLEKVIGVGGMAAVYAATHRNGMRGAVKMLHPEFANDTESRERFLREGYVANRVERGAVKVLDDDTAEDGSVYLVMELLTGETTDEIAQKRPNEQLSLPEVIWVGQALLEVLEQAHGVGIVHRDIKPENLFVCTNGELRVLDFGIARLRDGKPGSLKKTNTTNAMGTPAFMPAEQALADWDRVGPRSDIYSAGATMFTLLTGELTHLARTAQELMISVATKPARGVQSVMRTVPAPLAAVIDRACAFRPDDRFPDARAMRAALDAAAQGMQPYPPGQAPPTAPQLSSSGSNPQFIPNAHPAPNASQPNPIGYAATALPSQMVAGQMAYGQGQGGYPAPPRAPVQPQAQYPQAQQQQQQPQAQQPQAHQPHAYAQQPQPQQPQHAQQQYAQGRQSYAHPPTPLPNAQQYAALQNQQVAAMWSESSSVSGPISAPTPAHSQPQPPNSSAGVKMTMRVDPRAAQEAYMPAQWNTASGGMSPVAHLAKSQRPASNVRLVLIVVGAVLAIVLVVLVAFLATR